MLTDAISPVADPLRMGPTGLELIRAFEACMRAIKFGRRSYDGLGHTNRHLPQLTAGAVWSQTERDAVVVCEMIMLNGRHIQQLCKALLMIAVSPVRYGQPMAISSTRNWLARCLRRSATKWSSTQNSASTGMTP